MGIERVRVRMDSTRRHLPCRLTSSANDDLDFDKERLQRESQDLDNIIRGRRGISLEAVEREWRAELMRMMEEDGERLCAEAYGGYLEKGLGGMFVNVDVSMSNNQAGHSLERKALGVFRSLDEVVVERSDRVLPDDHIEIIRRCQEYNPETGFVVVFGHQGLVGVQIFRPSQPPRKVYEAFRSIGSEQGEWLE
ncbi:unnamed protein product [Choristocarpus tenellus]